MILLASHPLVAAGVAALWAALACLLPFLRAERHHIGFWTLVFVGVPVLGWLTYLWGPAFGVLFLGVGLLLLVWPPFSARGHTPANRTLR